MRRRRLAPSALRTAISPSRVAVRAKISVATLTLTTTRKSRNGILSAAATPAMSLLPGKRLTSGRSCSCVAGSCAAVRRPIVASSACASSIVTPGARRPSILIAGPSRRS